MNRIAVTTNPAVTTVVSTFTVSPGKQGQLLALLSGNVGWLGELPGFIGVSLHPSDDGTKIVSYAQWTSKDAFHAMLANPAMAEHRRQVTEMASVEVVRYWADSVHLKPPSATRVHHS